MRLLDRYVLRNFFEPFVICFLGFLGIWLVFDLSDNVADFIQAGASLKVIARFYLTQLPQIIIISLPVGVLLALLFALSRMSRRNEIISMLTAGVSVPRVVIPLAIVGALCAGALVALNYDLAPRAEAIRKTALEQISRHRAVGEVEPVNGHLFRDRQNGRTWFVRKYRPDSMQLDGVHISQQDEQGNIVKKWYAGRAIYDPRTKVWTLNRGVILDFNAAGDIAKMDNFEMDFRIVRDWSETPWRIGSARAEARSLTVPELRNYLSNNSDFPAVQLAPYRTYLQNRFAVPMQCFVIIFFAAPLAIVFSRRGVIGGVAAALGLYVLLFLSTEFFLALGKGSRLDPRLAVWIPNLFFLGVGLILLYFRGSNREFPPKLFRARRK
ncbi:MAG: lipopolysaccharide export system permease protein [Chthoniobacter sp.]|jgi:LPS export ABC transporter permease LptG|nr:lipopolysaccharide export system permease protein [Chthoniobacter sp.]